MEKGDPLQINPDEEKMKTVNIFKVKLTTPPVLVLPTPNGQYTIDADAFDTQVKCI